MLSNTHKGNSLNVQSQVPQGTYVMNPTITDGKVGLSVHYVAKRDQSPRSLGWRNSIKVREELSVCATASAPGNKGNEPNRNWWKSRAFGSPVTMKVALEQLNQGMGHHIDVDQ